LKEYYKPDNLINQEHIRNALIRSFWDGLSFSDLKYEMKLKVVQDKFFLGESQIKKILSHNEYKKKELIPK